MTTRCVPSAAVMSRAMGRWMDLAMFKLTLFGIVIVTSSATSSTTATSNPTFSSALSPTPVPTPPLSSYPSSPSSSMPPAPSSSVAPSPTSSPTLYELLDEHKEVCILMRAEITVTMNYTQAGGNTNEVTFNFNNDTAQVDETQSDCTDDKSHMTIKLHNGTTVLQYLTFSFERGQYQWKMSRVEQVVNALEPDFNNPNNTGVLNFGSNETFFLNEYQRSYKCNSISIKLKNLTSNNVTNSTEVVLDGLQVQAFEFRRNGTFGNARECPANQERNIKLPIAVGSLLLLFLTAVIVVYILSRFRKRQLTSYESLN